MARIALASTLACLLSLFFAATSYATECAVKPNVWSTNPEVITEKFKNKVSDLIFKSSELKEIHDDMGPVAVFEKITLTPEKGSGGNLKFSTSNRASTITFVPTDASSSMMDTEFKPLSGVLKVYDIHGRAKITGVLSAGFKNTDFPAHLILIGKGNACEVVLSKWIFTLKIPKDDINIEEIIKQHPNVDTSNAKHVPTAGILLQSSGEFVSGTKLISGD